MRVCLPVHLRRLFIFSPIQFADTFFFQKRRITLNKNRWLAELYTCAYNIMNKRFECRSLNAISNSVNISLSLKGTSTHSSSALPTLSSSSSSLTLTYLYLCAISLRLAFCHWNLWFIFLSVCDFKPPLYTYPYLLSVGCYHTVDIVVVVDDDGCVSFLWVSHSLSIHWHNGILHTLCVSFPFFSGFILCTCEATFGMIRFSLSECINETVQLQSVNVFVRFIMLLLFVGALLSLSLSTLFIFSLFVAQRSLDSSLNDAIFKSN